MGYFIDFNNNYYEGDKVNDLHTEVTQRTSPYYIWTNSSWNFSVSKYKLDKKQELFYLIKENWPEIDRTKDQIKTQWNSFKSNASGWTTKAQVDNAFDTALTWLGIEV